VVWVARWSDGDTVEKQILGLDVSVNDTPLLVEIPDSLGDLEDDVPGKCLGEVGEFDDLVEKFSALINSRMRK